MRIHCLLLMQEYRDISEIYNNQVIQLSIIKLINAILYNLGSGGGGGGGGWGGGLVHLTWPDCKSTQFILRLFNGNAERAAKHKI